MPAKVKDMTGVRHGRLVARKHVGFTKRRNALWECDCDCSGVVVVVQGKLTGSDRGVRSCGCLRRLNHHNALAPGEAGFNYLLRQYKYGAESRGIGFELSESQFRGMVGAECYYCGVAPTNTVTNSRDKHKHSEFIYNGVDRVDNTIGYTVENCVPCCKQCNLSKGVRSEKDFLAHAISVVEHSDRKRRFEALNELTRLTQEMGLYDS